MRNRKSDNPYEAPQTIPEAKLVALGMTSTHPEDRNLYWSAFLRKFVIVLFSWNILVFAGQILMYFICVNFIDSDEPMWDAILGMSLVYYLGLFGNGLALLVGLLLTRDLSVRNISDFSIFKHLLLSILLPIVAAIPYIGWITTGLILLTNKRNQKHA